MRASTEGIGHSRIPPGIAFTPRVLRSQALARQGRLLRRGVEHVHADGRAGLPDLERALVNPAAVFTTPGAVLDHPRLMSGCKREILRRWAWDEYLKEVAASEGMTEGEPSRLDEVKAALFRLDETWRPKPCAPAAAAPLLRQDVDLAAA